MLKFYQFVQEAIAFLKEKFTEVELKQGLLWGILIIMGLFILGQISHIAVYVAGAVLILFLGWKAYAYIAEKFLKKFSDHSV